MQGLQSRRPHSWRLIVSFVAAAAVLSTSLSACTTPITGSADSTASSSNKLQAPTEESPSGEITIWDRSGDLFGVFENTIADFNKKYPNIKVHHEAVDIDAKLQNTLITGTDVPDGVFLDDAKVSAFTDHLWDLSDVLNPYIKDISKQKVDVNRKSKNKKTPLWQREPARLLKRAPMGPSRGASTLSVAMVKKSSAR